MWLCISLLDISAYSHSLGVTFGGYWVAKRMLPFLGMGGHFSGSPGCSSASCLGELGSPEEQSNLCRLARDPATALLPLVLKIPQDS